MVVKILEKNSVLSLTNTDSEDLSTSGCHTKEYTMVKKTWVIFINCLVIHSVHLIDCTWYMRSILHCIFSIHVFGKDKKKIVIWVKKTIIYRFLPAKPPKNFIFYFFCEIIYFYRFFLPNCTILSCVFLARSQNIFIDFFLAKTQFYTPKVTNITYISLTDVVYIKGGVWWLLAKIIRS